MQWVYEGDLVKLYGPAGLPNPLEPERSRVKIVSTKCFLGEAIQSGVYGDIAWVGVLEPNAGISEHRATETATCGLAANTTYRALYHSAGEIATSSIKHTIISAPSGSKSDKLAL